MLINYGKHTKKISFLELTMMESQKTVQECQFYGQIQSFEVTNILIIVVRYFGGVKLGVGGLINAYRTAAKLALEASDIITKTVTIYNTVSHFDYKNMNTVMRVIKENKIKIINQHLELSCELIISVTIERCRTSVFDIFQDAL